MAMGGVDGFLNVTHCNKLVRGNAICHTVCNTPTYDAIANDFHTPFRTSKLSSAMAPAGAWRLADDPDGTCRCLRDWQRSRHPSSTAPVNGLPGRSRRTLWATRIRSGRLTSRASGKFVRQKALFLRSAIGIFWAVRRAPAI
jgi:hypothetical protein